MDEGSSSVSILLGDEDSLEDFLLPVGASGMSQGVGGAAAGVGGFL